MAGGDISATLRVNVVVDTAGAEAQIRDAISKLNTGNNVIRLRADASEALKEINSLKAEIAAVGKTPVSFGVTSAFGKMVSSGFGAASEQLSNINQQIQDLSKSGLAVKSLTQVSNAVGRIKSDRVTEATDAVGKLTTALDDLETRTTGGRGSGSTSTSVANPWTTKMNSMTKQIESMEMFFNRMKNIPGLSESGKDQLSAFQSAIDSYKDLQNKISGGTIPEDFGEQLVQVTKQASDAKVALQAVADAQKQLNIEQTAAAKESKANALTKDNSAYKSSVSEMTKEIEAMQSFYNKMNSITGLDKSGENELKQYASVLGEMRKLNDDLVQGGMDKGEYTSRFTDLIEKASKAKLELQQVADAQKTLNDEQAANAKKAQADTLSKDSAGFKSNMLEITKQIENMEKFRNSMSKIAGLDQSGASELEKYNSVLEKMKQLSADLDTETMKKGEYNTRYTALAKEASKAKLELQEVADAQKQLNTEQAAADKEAKANILTKDSSAYKSSALEMTKQIEAMQSFYNKMSSIAGLDKSGENELKRYASILDDMKRLQADLQQGDMDRGGYIQRFTTLADEASQAKTALQEVAEAQEKLNTAQAKSDAKAQADILTKGSDVFKTKVSEVTKSIEGMEKFLNGVNKIEGLDQSGTAELERYTSALEKMKQLSADLDKGNMTKSEYNTRFADITREASTAKTALQEVADAQKQINTERSKQSQDFIKEQNALREVAKLEQEIAQNSKKWSAAKNGKSAGAYEEYVKQADVLEDLKKQYTDGAISIDEFKAKTAEVKTAMQDCSSAIAAAGENTQGFGAQLAGAFKYFSMYFGMTQMVMKGIQTAKQMVQASIEIESAMNRIQIVTGATDSQMGQFFSTAAKQAQDLGKNITDVAGSIETFSRLGYSLGDATELSKYATIMSNVADTNVEAATTGLTSIIKGFGMEASDAEHVSDVLINVGQKYAISAEELMEAFERGGAAMNASGSSFEESAALFAATNASLQNASTTG